MEEAISLGLKGPFLGILIWGKLIKLGMSINNLMLTKVLMQR